MTNYYIANTNKNQEKKKNKKEKLIWLSPTSKRV
jgi:hypothetical protein